MYPDFVLEGIKADVGLLVPLHRSPLLPVVGTVCVLMGWRDVRKQAAIVTLVNLPFPMQAPIPETNRPPLGFLDILGLYWRVLLTQRHDVGRLLFLADVGSVVFCMCILG